MKRMVFLNIGWMKNYKGIDDGDKIVGGGSFVKEKGYGHEIFNFLSEKGKLYGYVQPVIPHETIKIERLGVSSTDSYVDNVIAIWVSKSPSGGVFIIGWYDNSTIYRVLQKPRTKTKRRYNDEIFGYYVEANEQDCTLLPIDERVFQIPRGKGAMGQSNVWYADQEKHLELKRKVIEFLKTGNKQSESNATNNNSQSKQPDPYIRQHVELAAIKETVKYYSGLGYEVFSVEKDNAGWDLEASIGKKKLLIEVKGLSQDQLIIELTPNEYKHMKDKKDNYRISVLTQALSKISSLSIFSYSPENGRWEDDNGNPLKINEIISARMRL